jgi:HlyD family secretion protein
MSKRSKFAWAAAALAAGVVGWLLFFPREVARTVVTDMARRVDLVQTVEVTGDLRSVDDASLAFGRSGSVEAVLARVGDAVRAGDVLAALDAGELEAAYAQALARADEAEANVALKRAGGSSERRAVARADVSVAQTALSAARFDADHARAVADAAVAEAEAAFERAGSDADAAAEGALEDLVEDLRSLVSQVRFALSDADAVLGVENTLYNREFDDVLSNTDAQALISAVNAFEDAVVRRDAAEEALLAMDAEALGSVEDAAETAEGAYAGAYAVLLQTSRVLDATSADSVEFSLDDLDSLKASVASATAALVADGSALNDARQAVADAARARVDDVRAARTALESARAARDRDVAVSEAVVSSREADIDRANAALADTEAVPRDVDLAPLLAMLDQTLADAAAAFSRLRDTRILAPIDGVVTAVDADPGEFVAAGTPVITVLSSGLAYEIQLSVPESDVAKIREGQTAVTTFDAFGDDLAFYGSVVSVDPAERVIEGVVFYEATVRLNAAQDLSGLKPGMSADVTMTTGARSGVVAIPTRAVLETDGRKYVRVQDSAGIMERDVTVGMRADGGLTEVLTGLEEGEVVVVSIK